MKFFKPIVALFATVIIVFVAVSLLDIFISVLFPGVYAKGLFIVTFCAGGIFAAALGFIYAMQQVSEKNEKARWILISLQMTMGLFIFFLLSKIEGGEYASAFKAFGSTLALGSLLFVKAKGNHKSGIW